MPKITEQKGGVSKPKPAMAKYVPPTKKGAVPKAKPGANVAYGDVWDRIKPMEFDPNAGISVCLYGNSGTGKTTFWATFPDPILAIICSGGKNPGELKSVNTGINRQRIETITIQDSFELLKIVEGQLATNKFRTLVLDHVSGLQDWVLMEILGLSELPPQKSWGMASQNQYGQCSLKTKELLRPMLDLTCNRVFVNQERIGKEGGDNDILVPYVGPGLMPGLAGWLMPSCDYIVQSFKRQKVEEKSVKIGSGPNAKTQITKTKLREVEYCLRTGPDPVYVTKFRLPVDSSAVVPEVLIDPSYDQMIEIIQAGSE